MKLKSLTRTAHYPSDDKKFLGDYASVDLEVVTDSVMTVFYWGDGYHDRGWEKTEGAIEVLQKLFGTVKVKEKQKADADNYY